MGQKVYWHKATCIECNEEAEFSRTVPRDLDEEQSFVCYNCKDYKKAYEDGFKAGQESVKKELQELNALMQQYLSGK